MTATTITMSDRALKAGETSLVTISSWPSPDSPSAYATASGGTLSAWTGSGDTYTATFTPSSDYYSVTNSIALNMTVVDGSDPIYSENYAIDTARPSSQIVVSDSTLTVGETAAVTINFSEAVTGLSLDDLVASNGTLSNLDSGDGGLTWTATFTPGAAVGASTNLITLDNTQVTDIAGNTGSGTTASNNYAVQTTTPTATIGLSDYTIASRGIKTVTITFSEAVTGLTAGDFTVSNGTITTPTSSNGGVTWKAGFTPTTMIEVASNNIVLNLEGINVVSSGNAGVGTVTSSNYEIDTKKPIVAVTFSDTELTIGETAIATFAFSEKVQGFESSDITHYGTLGTFSGFSTTDNITWTAIFTPPASVEQRSPGTLRLNVIYLADLFGNEIGGGSVSFNGYTIDTVRPTSTIALGDSTLTAGESTTVTVTFSEAVPDFTTDDLTASNGSLGTFVSSNSGITWTASYTPDADLASATNVITIDNTGIADAAGNAGSGATSSANFTIDTVRPSATITVADTALTIGETSLVTIVFSQAVSGFSNDDLTVANGTLGAVASEDGITWTATFTPSADIEDASNAVPLDMSGVAASGSGNAGAGTAISNNYAVDTVRPTATITLGDSALAAGESTTVTITFSEAVTGFSASDLTVANGTLGTLRSADGGITWTASYTPDADLASATNVITIDNTGTADAAGNAGSGTTSSANFTIDTVRPTATITVADTALKIGETSLVTIVFSQAVSGFSNDDLTVANGTLGPVTSDDGITWTATFTPSADIEDASDVVTLDMGGVAANSSGNAGAGTAASNNYAIDTVRPTAKIALGDSTLTAGESTTVTVTFSEAVTGFSASDLTVANGTLGTPGSLDGGITWTASYTPGADRAPTTNVITLDNTGVADASGNAGSGATSSASFTIDTVRPSAIISVADTALKAGETSLVTIVFSQAVSGFSNDDLTVANGTLGPVTSDDGITWTATFTPSADIEDASDVVTLDMGGVAANSSGNAGAGTAASNNYAIDTVRPTAKIALGDSTLTAGESTTVTVTFSEAVIGFSASDLAVANGTLGTLRSSDGGITWTASYTPGADRAPTTNFITLDNTGVADASGNAGSGATSSANFTIDTVRPSATITVADTALTIGETSLVTIVFSQAVSGFSNDDLTVANGTLGAVTSDDGITWTATFTPSATTEDASNAVTLDMFRVAASGSGNAGAGTATSNTFDIDTASPVAAISIAAATLGPNDNTMVTIVFSEPVANLTLGALAADNATLSGLSSSDGGVTWTATLTPDANVRASGNVVRMDGFTDAAGNPGAAVASGTFSIDSVPPQSGVVDTVDGVETTTETSVDPVTGLESGTITIPVVASDRSDDGASPNADMADIPLRFGEAGLIDLVVSLPVGSGMVVERPTSPLQPGQAIPDLIARIESIAAPSSRQDMVNLGSSFLQGLDQTVPVHTATLTPTEGGSAGNGATLHIGAGSGLGRGQIGLVVDVSGLAHAPVIELNDVQFAAIIGAASLRGGAGRNVVVGDDAAQTIFLGADDDMLYGGGGDDIIGSAGGNDLLDGGAGHDMVAGGIGNDRLFGGSGDDVLSGGRSDRGAWQFVLGADGALGARHETAAYNPGSWEPVALAELDTSAPGLSFLRVPAERIETLALLYHAIAQRTPDLAGLAFWAQYDGSAAEIAQMMTGSDEFTSGTLAALDNAAFVRSLYTHTLGRAADAGGVAFWTAQLGAASPISRADVLLAFALSDEHQAHARTGGELEIANGTLLQESQWFAGSGDDLLDGGLGSDRLDGGDGIDTVAYGGALAQYRFILGADGSIGIADTVNGDIDLVRSIERGAFADGVIDLSFTQANSDALQAVGLMYHCLFDRAGDPAGISWWCGLSSDTAQLAEWLMASAEFQHRYGAASDLEFVQALFSNTGIESGAAGGLAFWLDYATTHDRAELVTAWIEHAEVIGVQFAGNGLWL